MRAADLHLRGIPLGELAPLDPGQVAVLAITGDLPSASLQRDFDAWASNQPDLLEALRALETSARWVADSAPASSRDFAAALCRCYFAMELASPDSPAWAATLGCEREVVDSARWLSAVQARIACGERPETAAHTIVSQRIAELGYLPGFGDPLVLGVDPRFVALHAIVMRQAESGSAKQAMEQAVRLAPEIARRAGVVRFPRADEPGIEAANRLFPVAAGLLASSLDADRAAQRLVTVAQGAQRAVKQATKRWSARDS